MTPTDYYLFAHGAVTVLVLGQLLRVERRFGCSDVLLKRIKNHCRLFDGECIYEKEKEEKRKEEMGQDRTSEVGET